MPYMPRLLAAPWRWLPPVVAVATLALGDMQRSHAEVPVESPGRFCALAGTDDTLRPIPPSLAPAVNMVFHTRMPTNVAVRTTVFRCAEGRVLVCGVGANLPCGKADTSRSSTGGVAWCRDHPDATFIPAYATGHATVYDWRCQAGVPVAVSQRYHVDPRGFVAEYWRPLP